MTPLCLQGKILASLLLSVLLFVIYVMNRLLRFNI
jgi:hypothetical protein